MNSKLTLLAAVFSVLAACTAEPTMPLRNGICDRLGCDPMFLARDFGAARVQIVEYASTAEIQRAFRNRTVEATAMSLEEILLFAQYDPDICVVLVTAYSNGADAIVAKSQYTHFDALKGRRVGVANTALSAYVLSRALEINPMRGEDITVVPLPVDAQARAFDADIVAAAITYGPIRTRLVSLGGRVLFDSRQLPGEGVNVLVFRTAYVKSHPDTVTNILKGWFRALDYIRTRPNDAAAHLAATHRLPTEIFSAALRGFIFPPIEENRRLLAGRVPGLLDKEKRLAAFMLRHKLLAAPVNLAEIPKGQLLVTLRQTGELGNPSYAVSSTLLRSLRAVDIHGAGRPRNLPL